MTKLMPNYVQKLDEKLIYNGRHRNLYAWRKPFKAQWMKCKSTPISDPDDPKYATDPHRWVCTCPAFIRSRFLICKHLVQSVHPVSARFFIEVTRRRTTPFWQHPDLRPLFEDPNNGNSINEGGNQEYGVTLPNTDGFESPEEIDDLQNADRQFLMSRATFDESLDHRIGQIRDFINALEYQRQFRDPRFLLQVEQHGLSFFRYIEECQILENRVQSRVSPNPRTWERGGRTMFYRTRARGGDS